MKPYQPIGELERAILADIRDCGEIQYPLLPADSAAEATDAVSKLERFRYFTPHPDGGYQLTDRGTAALQPIT